MNSTFNCIRTNKVSDLWFWHWADLFTREPFFKPYLYQVSQCLSDAARCHSPACNSQDSNTICQSTLKEQQLTYCFNHKIIFRKTCKPCNSPMQSKWRHPLNRYFVLGPNNAQTQAIIPGYIHFSRVPTQCAHSQALAHMSHSLHQSPALSAHFLFL